MAAPRSKSTDMPAAGMPAAESGPLRSVALREQALLAGYAMHSADSAGREYPEQDHPYRGPFQRDRDRIVHSAAFRRLSDKTQVFTGVQGDYHRTRLTHTMEVASVSRTIGRTLALNEDLIEALALVHDLGHPPFGHSGEDALDELLQGQGGFSHNAQALRIVRELETPILRVPWIEPQPRSARRPVHANQARAGTAIAAVGGPGGRGGRQHHL